ncbi:MAG: hypothetical protein NTY86_07065 [Deltaproteobacteria bacterium]|nr:hypothetical protein [Deltaproteobacteria bacterium]
MSLPAKRRSGADDVISALPHDYDTILGKRFEDGKELSMGEWQKVALPRAFKAGHSCAYKECYER